MNNEASTHPLILKLKYVFSTFSIPKQLVSDTDPKVKSAEIIAFCVGK